jgi:ATP-binding cassette subfamily B (MDR/TAP) protein 1
MLHVAAGAGMPIFATILGSIMNDFGFNQDDPQALTDKVNSVVPYFAYLGIGTCIGAYCQGFFWAAASVRQVNRMRAAYVHAVLRQDVTFFDTTGTSGRLLQGLNEDCITIQSAIGDKVAMFIFQMTTAVAGIIIGEHPAPRVGSIDEGHACMCGLQDKRSVPVLPTQTTLLPAHSSS